MRVNLNIGQQNNFLNIHRINQSLFRNEASRQSSIRGEQKDTVMISPQGKAKSLIQSLVKQKQNILEQKNKLIGATLEKGGTMDKIKSQLKSYEEQLKNIDEQIAQAMTTQAEKQAKQMKKNNDNKPKTEEEIQNERLANITNISTDLKQAEVVSSVKTKVEGEASILKSEIELDKMRSGSSEGIVKKEEKLAQLQQQSANLTSQIGEKLIEATDHVEANNKPRMIAPDDTEKGDKTEVNKNNAIDNVFEENKDK